VKWLIVLLIPYFLLGCTSYIRREISSAGRFEMRFTPEAVAHVDSSMLFLVKVSKINASHLADLTLDLWTWTDMNNDGIITLQEAELIEKLLKELYKRRTLWDYRR